MRKHTLLAMMVAFATFMVGFWGSMHSVSAKDASIVVIPLGTGMAATKVGTKSVASNTANGSSSITIEVVRDNTKSEPDAGNSDLKGAVAGISYDKLVMANVEEAVNIRDQASENGKLIGKFYKECGGSIIEKGNGWTKLKTGEVTGWVKNDYLLFGNDAVELANKVVEKTATCTTDCLRVRKTADANGTVLDLLAEGDQIGVLSEKGEWVEVEYSDGDIGYVSSDYVEIADELGTGETIEAIAEREKAEKAAEASAKAATVTAAKGSAPAAQAAAVPATGYSDVVLLAALIQAEAGTQPYEGQVAVGNVVTNRLATGRYGNSIYSVIYAKSQFGPAGNGQVAQIAAAGPKATCINAAQAALSGVNYVGPATHFRNIKSGNQGIVIGAHVFW